MTKSKKTIFLMGMPGSGKTYLGSEAAMLGDFTFYDLDRYIQEQQGRSLPEIFTDQGEEYFRDMETVYLKELISKPEAKVIALGGGTPCFNNNLEVIQANGISIYIKVPLEVLVIRLLPEAHLRPLLKDKDEVQLRAYLQKLLQERELFYREAHYTLENISLTADAILRAANVLPDSKT